MEFSRGYAIDMESELDALVGATRLPTWDDLDSLLYLQALIKELHRWAPIAIVGKCGKAVELSRCLLMETMQGYHMRPRKTSNTAKSPFVRAQF